MSKLADTLSVAFELVCDMIGTIGKLILKLLIVLAVIIAVVVSVFIIHKIGLRGVILLLTISAISIALYHIVFFFYVCYNVGNLPKSYDEFLARYKTREEAIFDIIMHRKTLRPDVLYVFMVFSFPIFIILFILDSVDQYSFIYENVYPWYKTCYSSRVNKCVEYYDKTFQDERSIRQYLRIFDTRWVDRKGVLTLEDISLLMPTYYTFIRQGKYDNPWV